MGQVHPFVEYQFASASTDFDRPDFNPVPGSLGGHTVRLGVRFEL